MSAVVASGPLLGRDAELASLGALVRDVAVGRGRAVWIEGEAGIGKSTLLANGLAGAEPLGCRLLVLAADELAQRFPLRVLLDGLGARLRSSDPELRAIAELAGGELPDALDREGRIDHTSDTAELVDQRADIPRSLTATIATRLGFVSEPAMEMLRPAALLGTVFSATDLATVCGRPVPELASAIHEVMAAGLLVESGSRLAFRHALPGSGTNRSVSGR